MNICWMLVSWCFDYCNIQWVSFFRWQGSWYWWQCIAQSNHSYPGLMWSAKYDILMCRWTLKYGWFLQKHSLEEEITLWWRHTSYIACQRVPMEIWTSRIRTACWEWYWTDWTIYKSWLVEKKPQSVRKDEKWRHLDPRWSAEYDTCVFLK